jgi:hypothetical protein
MLKAIRGDFFCSALGENWEAYRGVRLPPHVETANLNWYALNRGETSAGRWIRMAVEMPLQGGQYVATTAVLNDHSVIYQRHDLEGHSGPVNPGYHATLAFPDAPNAGRGFDDLAIVCADPRQPCAWSAATCAALGYVWFALRNPPQVASTLLWFSNGGTQAPPWNGRHVNVLAIEDVTAFFDLGIAASCRKNLLATIEFLPDREANVLSADSGRRVLVRCAVDFLHTGKLAGVEFPQ